MRPEEVKIQRVWYSQGSEFSEYKFPLDKLPEEIILKILVFAQAPRVYGVSKRFQQLQNETDKEAITQIALKIFGVTCSCYVEALSVKKEESYHTILARAFENRESECFRLFRFEEQRVNQLSKADRSSFEYFTHLDQKVQGHIYYQRALVILFNNLRIDGQKKDEIRVKVNDRRIALSERADIVRRWMNVNQKVLDEIKTLCLTNRGLEVLPFEITKLRNLERLFLQRNNFTSFPWQICNLKKLKILNIFNNKFTEIPPSIGELENLEILNVSNNELRRLPNEVCKLRNLQEFNICHCPIDVLPRDIGRLSALKFFSAYAMGLVELPNSLFDLNNLRMLEVSENQLTHISPRISELRALRYLHLSKNPFEELPPEIGSLDLLDLSLNGLHLENIPEFVFRLSKLKRLYVNRCLLSQFPFELREINNLELLAISGNRFVLGDCPGMVPNYIDGCLDWSVERRNKTKIIKVY